MKLLIPDWPAAKHVKAISTTRVGGVSEGAFASLNIAHQVEDSPEHVAKNRALLEQAAGMPSSPVWLTQVHGLGVVQLPHSGAAYPEGDASYTTAQGQVCAVMSADCLPVLFCNQAGTEIAAAHAGWRGLLDGVLESTVAAFSNPSEVMAWFGPAIGPQAFEVDNDVRDAFIAKNSDAHLAFVAHGNLWLGDMYQLARQRLAKVGVTQIYGGGRCTYTEAEQFFSFRRDNKTGRQATCIWLER